MKDMKNNGIPLATLKMQHFWGGGKNSQCFAQTEARGMMHRFQHVLFNLPHMPVAVWFEENM